MPIKHVFTCLLLSNLVLLGYLPLENKALAQSATAKLSLDLALHGIGSAGDNVSIGAGNTNPLHKDRSVKIDIYNSANQISVTKQGTVTFNSSTGRFAGIIDVGNISSNSYIVEITAPQYLVKRAPGVINITSGSNTSISQVSLTTGDTKADNVLNILDYNKIIDCFSSLSAPRNCSDPADKMATDLNDDGDVEQFDYNLFLRELSVQNGDEVSLSPTSSDEVSLLPPTSEELEAIGLLSVTARGADPTCTTDSTDAIQQTIDEAYDRQMVVFFPEGTYCISSTIKAHHVSTGETAGHELVGSTLGNKPIIKLKAGSSGFGNVSAPKAVIWMTTLRGEGGENGGGQGTGDIDDAIGFRQSIRNIDIEVEANNPGAVGIEFTGAQGNSLQNINIKLNSGYAGFSGFIGDNSAITNLEVTGGKYGITRGTQGGSVKWPSMTNVRLFNQTDAAIYDFRPTNFIISGLHIKKNKAPAIVVLSKSSTQGNFTLIDAKIEFETASSDPTILNTGNRSIALLNCFVFNSSESAGHWQRIGEHAEVGSGVNVINGVVSSTIHKVDVTASTPPTDLLDRHAIPLSDMHSPDTILAMIKSGRTDVVNAFDEGILPAESGWELEAYGKNYNRTPDITQKLQTLINRGVKVILFPKGKYILSNTIELGAETHIMGIANQFTGFIMSDDWQPTSSNPVTMFRTPDSKSASPKLSFIKIVWRTDPSSYDYFKGIIHIRSGKTLMNDTHIRPNTSKATGDLHPNIRFLFTGNAGGKFSGQL